MRVMWMLRAAALLLSATAMANNVDPPKATPATVTPAPAPTETPAPTQAPTPAPTPTPTPTPAPTPPKDEQWYWENEDDPRFAASTADFKTFRADDATQTCSQDLHATPFSRQVRGVNLGGWLVLQPSITPSLFYQFLGTQERFGDLAPNKTAMDSYTFCTALGKEEANRQLRIHWASWVTETDIAQLAAAGVNSVRVPVGDWMFVPYEPYLGCTDGAVEELDRLVDLAAKYDMDVLIDLHGLIGSQNGLDTSGHSTAVKWTSIASTRPVGTTTFEHWPIRSAEWAGTYDAENRNYTSINYQNLNHSLEAVMAIAHRYAGHDAVLGLQPINEPWELTPINVLKNYYWKSYKRIKALAPKWKFVLHDSFRFGVEYWSEFMRGCPDIALDTHIYQAWNNPGTRADFFEDACKQKNTISDMENKLMPVIVGEWSAATDSCAMWLNGFNDNQPGFPKVTCTLAHCPFDSTYLYKGFPGTPLDMTSPVQGPYGTGYSGPSFGMCQVTSNVSFGQSRVEHERQLVRSLISKKLNAFAVGHGWYFWNFKVELDTRWDFLKLVQLGAFPANVSAYNDADGISAACEHEDKGDFFCRAKRGVQRSDLQAGYNLVCSTYEIDCTTMDDKNMTLEEKCDWAFNEYWHLHRMSGATCDFGGAAHLLMLATATHESNTPIAEVSTTTGEASLTSFIGTFGQPLSVVMVLVAGIAVGGLVGTGAFHWYRRRNYSPINSGRA